MRPTAEIVRVPSPLLPREQGEQTIYDPALGLGIALAEESSRRIPDVLEHMNDIDRDDDANTGGTRRGLDPVRAHRNPCPKRRQLGSNGSSVIDRDWARG